MTENLQPWSSYVDLMKRSSDLMQMTWSPQDEHLRGELYRQLLMNFTLGYFLYFQADPEHPDFSPFRNSVFMLQPNPDDTVHYAPVRGSGVYRIRGTRGTVRILSFTIGAHMLGMSDTPSQFLAEYDGDTLTPGSEGYFDVLLSRERPQGYAGNWWHLDPRAEYVLVRMRSYDWAHEQDARLAIECVDASEPKPRLTPAQIDEKIRSVIAFADRMTRFWLRYLNSLRQRDITNKVEPVTFSGGLASQQYWQGIFDLDPSEALILETELPAQCRYWNIQLNDPLWNTIEFIQRQSSLNASQARLDTDGRFRAVISLQDPGVPNWLDTSGYSQGTFVGRWYEASSKPMPTLLKVPLAAVRDYLPVDTPHVIPAQRQQTLHVRRIGGQLRRRW